MDHYVSRSEKRKSLLLFVILVAVALILSVLVVKIPSSVEKFYDYGDESYRPMDLDRDPDRDLRDHIRYEE